MHLNHDTAPTGGGQEQGPDLHRDSERILCALQLIMIELSANTRAPLRIPSDSWVNVHAMHDDARLRMPACICPSPGMPLPAIRPDRKRDPRTGTSAVASEGRPGTVCCRLAERGRGWP